MLDHIRTTGSRLAFPKEAIDTMCMAYDAIWQHPVQKKLWEETLWAYQQTPDIDYQKALVMADETANVLQLHKYTVQLLLFLLMTKGLRTYYSDRQLPEQIYWDSCKDLYWKLMECHDVYGIWGSFVARWFSGFFRLNRFALGRFQFELNDFPDDYEKAGHRRPPEMTKVISVHIPSAGKLDRRTYLESYRMAAQFFSDAFPGEQIAFFCASWMLFEPHRTFLKADSGVVQFMNDYDIYRLEYTNNDMWRIFHQEYDENAHDLPEETSMQRGYKQWLLSGHTAGYGVGICIKTKHEIQIWE